MASPNPPKLLVSLCNVRRWAKHLRQPAFLAVVDLEHDSVEPVALDLVKVKRTGGVTGLTRYGDGYAAIVQSRPHSQLCVLGPDLSVQELRPLEGVTRAHSLLALESEMLVVSTGTDKVVRLSDNGRHELVWEFAPGDQNTGHLNSILSHDGALYVSGFGGIAREGPVGGKGFVVDILSGDRVLEGLSQPHSLLSDGEGGFWVVDSGSSRIVHSGGGELTYEGRFYRGLAQSNGELYLGRSARRTKPGVADTPGEATVDEAEGECTLIVTEPPGPAASEGTVHRKIELGSHALEIYDVLPLR